MNIVTKTNLDYARIRKTNKINKNQCKTNHNYTKTNTNHCKTNANHINTNKHHGKTNENHTHTNKTMVKQMKTKPKPRKPLKNHWKLYRHQKKHCKTNANHYKPKKPLLVIILWYFSTFAVKSTHPRFLWGDVGKIFKRTTL